MPELNPNFPLWNQGVSNAREIGALPRHRWYFMKEGFSPKLVEEAINTDGAQRGDVVVDPFSGSGTAALTAASLGLSAYGFEINPFLSFLSSAKLQEGSSDEFRKASQQLCPHLYAQRKSSLEGFSTFVKGNRWNRWLFPISVLRTFEAGKRAVGLAKPRYQALLKLALIGAAMDCSNAIPDGKCVRFRKEWEKNEATPAILRERFQLRSGIIADDLDEVPLRGSGACVIKGDSRKLLEGFDKQFRLCVTSPPYLNSFDYSDVYRPELFLGDFVTSTEMLMKVRLNTIRSHVQARWALPTKTNFGSLYKECIEQIKDRVEDLWDRRLPTMVQAYFEDMDMILTALRKRAAANASLWMVVSTSAYAGMEVPVDLILAEIGPRCGWFLREVGVLRHLRSSSQHVQHVSDKERKSVPLRESVVIFDASRRPTPTALRQKATPNPMV